MKKKLNFESFENDFFFKNNISNKHSFTGECSRNFFIWFGFSASDYFIITKNFLNVIRFTKIGDFDNWYLWQASIKFFLKWSNGQKSLSLKHELNFSNIPLSIDFIISYFFLYSILFWLKTIFVFESVKTNGADCRHKDHNL